MPDAERQAFHMKPISFTNRVATADIATRQTAEEQHEKSLGHRDPAPTSARAPAAARDRASWPGGPPCNRHSPPPL